MSGVLIKLFLNFWVKFFPSKLYVTAPTVLLLHKLFLKLLLLPEDTLRKLSLLIKSFVSVKLRNLLKIPVGLSAALSSSSPRTAYIVKETNFPLKQSSLFFDGSVRLNVNSSFMVGHDSLTVFVSNFSFCGKTVT